LKAAKQSDRGSIAVEAAMIVPIVIIAVIVVIYIMMLIFQTSLMQVTANNIAERAAATYYHKYSSLMSGRTSKETIAGLGLYRRWTSNSEIQQNDYEVFAINTLQQRSILKGSSDVEIKRSGNIINQRITVTLISTYKNPLGSLTKLWGLKNKISLRVRAEATIDDPAEFIRNTDFIIETASRLPIISDFEAKWQDIINKIIDYIDKLTKEKVVVNA
jgi:ABC-type transport system involved in multi-copper enzyme maturation permease subunit